MSDPHDHNTSAMHDSVETDKPFDGSGGEGSVHRMKARHAKAAMGEVAGDLKRNLTKLADPRPLIKRHPLATAGIGAAAGLGLGVLLAPSPRKKLQQRLDAIEYAMRNDRLGRAKHATRKSRPFARRMLLLAWRFGKGPILAMVTGSLSGAASAPSQEDVEAAAEGAVAEGAMRDAADAGVGVNMADVT